MSWKPDPQACAVDALSVSWKDIYFYAFPPFSMILKVLQKIQSILVRELWLCSAAARGGVPISSILATAGWSRESTFRKYYNKPLVSKDYNVQNVLN